MDAWGCGVRADRVATPEEPETVAAPRGVRWVVLGLAGLSGWAVMAYEMVAQRIIAPVFGNDVHTWGSIIGVFVLCMAGGYGLGGRLSRGPRARRALVIGLGAAGVWVAATALIAPAAAEWLWQIAIEHIGTDLRPAGLVASLLLFGPAAMIFGMTLPLATGIVVRRAGEAGASVGILCAWSTVGGFFGTILTTFYFVTWWPVSTILLIHAGALGLGAAVGGVVLRGRATADHGAGEMCHAN